MRYWNRKTTLRAAATALVLLAQFQLLWVAAVHCHELPLGPRSAAFRPVNPTQQPASANAEVQCPACNLIHQSVTQASPEFSVPQPSLSERYPLPISLVRAGTGDMPVSHGRAPPLT